MRTWVSASRRARELDGDAGGLLQRREGRGHAVGLGADLGTEDRDGVARQIGHRHGRAAGGGGGRATRGGGGRATGGGGGRAGRGRCGAGVVVVVAARGGDEGEYDGTGQQTPAEPP